MLEIFEIVHFTGIVPAETDCAPTYVRPPIATTPEDCVEKIVDPSISSFVETVDDDVAVPYT